MERDPLGFKHELALRIVSRFHGEDAAKGAREHFQRVVQRKEVPNDVPERALPLREGDSRSLVEILESLGMAKSRSEARRLLVQHAVSVDGHRIDDPASSLTRGSYLLQVGKRRFVRLSLGEPGSETAS